MSRRHEAGHHGGAWKVAYADFVTAMMALFIVLWILGTDEKSKAAVASYFRNPSILNGGEGKGYLNQQGIMELEKSIEQIEAKEAADSIQAEEPTAEEKKGPITPEEIAERGVLAESADELKVLLQSNAALHSLEGQVQIEFTSQGLRIQLNEVDGRPLFEVGSAQPTTSTVTFLSALAGVVQPLPNLILVEGHTDARPYSGKNNYTNWELSGDRANAARRVLERAGLTPSRIARVVGYADRRPLDEADPMSEHNRRISITVCYRSASLD